ncbi:flagellar hook-length control protein FliK [Parashewanella tropica]|uniref:flagellar hook-length control protein FliK n=1 Tax=Parashewanella tropica TaxID=2547970 RepID=UPI001FE5280B|nr:flagellar hook-length control protein FliK [Parashewanella tropica]
MSQVNPLSFMSQVSTDGVEANVALSNDANVDSTDFAQRLSELSNDEKVDSSGQPNAQAEVAIESEKDQELTQEQASSPESLLAQISDSQNYQTAVTPVTQTQSGEVLPPNKSDTKDIDEESESGPEVEGEGDESVVELKLQVSPQTSTSTPQEADTGDVENESIAKLEKVSPSIETATNAKKVEAEIAKLPESGNSEPKQTRQVLEQSNAVVKEAPKAVEATTAKPVIEPSLTKAQAKQIDAVPQITQDGNAKQGQEADSDSKVHAKLAEMTNSVKPNTEMPTKKVDLARVFEAVSQSSTEPTPVAERINQSQTHNPFSLHQAVTPEGRTDVPQLHVSLRQGGEQTVQMQDMIQRFSPVMKQQLMAMVNKGIGQAEIRLDPPELGHMTVRIQVQNDQTQVQFQVANPQARDLLEQAQPRLRDMLAEQGMNLADSQISYHDGGQHQGGEQGRGQGFSGSDTHSELEQETSEQITLKVATNPSSVIDYYA